jgi:hypothetical protein
MAAAYLGGTSRAPVDQADKEFQTARAKLAMAGYQLHRIDDGTGGAMFLVQRWDRSRTLPDLPAVAAFLEQALGPKA